MVCWPSVPASGVPLRVAVPSLLSTKVTPFGHDSEVRLGVGVPIAVTVKGVAATPTLKLTAPLLLKVI